MKTIAQPTLRLSLLSAALLLVACAEMAKDEAPPAPADITGAQPLQRIEPAPQPEGSGADPEAQRLATQVAREEIDARVAVRDMPQAARKMIAAEASAGAAVVALAPPAYHAQDAVHWQAPVRDNERYQSLDDNPVKPVAQEPVSTFSLDVDTGSYANVRRMINSGRLPPKDAVRVEEMINYFPYDYPRARDGHPFGVGTELAASPWHPQRWLLRVSVRAEDVAAAEMPPANLVFLVDVSGSMNSPDKLPLLQQSLKLLVEQLRAQDRVALVVYAGRESVVLEPTPGDRKAQIRNAIDALTAGGSTAGEAGIALAYRMARQGYIKGGINRVLLATDGDFNVGVADTGQLKSMVERERASGVSLSTLGFGTGNYNEAMMEQLADVGNGNYSYIDTLQEGRKVLVDQARSTLMTVAKDVKVQVEFNPREIAEYRLIGYENRMLRREDFNNDAVDAGDVGAGATVTALYELTPVGATPSVDPLRYGVPGAQAVAPVSRAAAERSTEVAFVRVRYKQPEGATSRLLEQPVLRTALQPVFAGASEDLRFAAAVAGFGQLLRGGRHTGGFGYGEVLDIAVAARGRDEWGYRGEFLGLVRTVRSLSGS